MDDTPSYLAEVEAVFTQARGRGLMLAEADVALVDSWEARGLPVHLVCRALTAGVDAWREEHGERRPPPHRLSHYKDFIESAACQQREGLLTREITTADAMLLRPNVSPSHQSDEHRCLSNLLLKRAKLSKDARVTTAWTAADALLHSDCKGLPEDIAREQLFDFVCDEIVRQLTHAEQSTLDSAVESRLLPERARLGASGIAIRRQAMLREEVASLFTLEALTDE